MKEFFLLVAYFCVASVFVGLGILLFISPMRTRRLLDRLARADRWQTPNPAWQPRREVEARIAGLFLALMGLLFIGVPAYWLFTGEKSEELSGKASPGINWGSFVILCGVLALGGYLFGNPSTIANWGKRTAPHRIFPATVPDAVLKLTRLVGACLALFALYSIARMFAR